MFLSAIILYTKDICVLIRCRLIYTSLDMCYFMKLNFHFDRLHMHRYFYLLFNNLLLLQNCYPYHLQFLLPKPQFPLHKFLHCMLHLIIPHLLPQYLTSCRFLSLHPLPIILISVSLLPKINIIWLPKERLVYLKRNYFWCTYQQAFKDPNCVTTMEKEYQALISNNTWQLVLTPSHGISLGVDGFTG